MTKPEVSIVCTVYKRPHYIPSLMESVFAQTLTNWELIFVDDGSDMPELTEICRRYEKQDKRVRYIQLEKNSGVSVARNRGIAEAAAEFVALQDDDDLMHPQRLQKQVDFLRQNPQIPITMCYAGEIDKAGNSILQDSPEISTTPLIYKPTPPLAYFTILGTGLCFCRERLMAAGGFRDDYDNGAEDIEFVLRMEEKYPIALLREELYFARKHGEGHLSNSIYIWKYATLALVAAYYRRANLPPPVIDEHALLSYVSVLPEDIISVMLRRARGSIKRLLHGGRYAELENMLGDFHTAFSFNKKYRRKMHCNLLAWCLYYGRLGALPIVLRSMAQ